jgi:hypothetical protein
MLDLIYRRQRRQLWKPGVPRVRLSTSLNTSHVGALSIGTQCVSRLGIRIGYGLPEGLSMIPVILSIP